MADQYKHGDLAECAKCGAQIRLQTYLLGDPVEATWRSEADGSIVCDEDDRLHEPKG